nr:AraC family transcriptional regulator [Cohnella sp. CFH 77786]
MIVDDEARIRRGIERLVLSCGEGWEVAAAVSDGFEALEYLRRSGGGVDLLITDVKMPEMDGLELIREAKKHYTFYPLVISGYDDFAYVRSALREGALDYLLKPVDREQFRERMADIRNQIASGRYRVLKWGEMEKEAAKLKESRQSRTLAAVTSAEADLASFGYWVEEFPTGRYLLSCIRLDTLPVKARSYSAKDWKAYYYALENMIGEIAGSFADGADRQAWYWRGADSDFWTLLQSGDAERDVGEDAYAMAERIRSAIRTYTPFSVSVSFGEPFEDLYLLPDAKRQALHLMNYRLIYGDNQVFRPAQEKADNRVNASSDFLALAQQLKRSIEQTRASQSAELVDKLFDKLERLDSPELLQSVLQNVVILIHSARVESQGSIGRSTPVEQELAQLKKAAHLSELKRQVNRLAGQAIRDIEASRDSGSAGPVEQAKAWIREHLGHDLTIKKIADQVHMNPTYFCECFKLQTGETILDYLTALRIGKAKELLLDPGMKLSDVSPRVGYQDAKYFSRLFKQWTGQTPTQYRDNAGI